MENPQKREGCSNDIMKVVVNVNIGVKHEFPMEVKEETKAEEFIDRIEKLLIAEKVGTFKLFFPQEVAANIETVDDYIKSYCDASSEVPHISLFSEKLLPIQVLEFVFSELNTLNGRFENNLAEFQENDGEGFDGEDLFGVEGEIEKYAEELGATFGPMHESGQSGKSGQSIQSTQSKEPSKKELERVSKNTEMEMDPSSKSEIGLSKEQMSVPISAAFRNFDLIFEEMVNERKKYTAAQAKFDEERTKFDEERAKFGDERAKFDKERVKWQTERERVQQQFIDLNQKIEDQNEIIKLQCEDSQKLATRVTMLEIELGLWQRDRNELSEN